MDVVGVFAVAFITAFGGGTVRDVLLDRRPFFWVEHQGYVWLIFVLTLVAAPWLHKHRDIVTALERRDAEWASAAMMSHIISTKPTALAERRTGA